LYAFYFGNQTHPPEAEYAHHLQNSDSSVPSAIAVWSGGSYEVDIFMSSVSVPGQQYADKMRLIRITGATRTSPTLVQKEISANTIGPISVFSSYDEKIIGSTRHYVSESPTLNSAQLFKVDGDLDTSTFSPAGAVDVDSISSYTHSSLQGSLTNTVLTDLDTLRSNVYHSSLANVNRLDSGLAVLTDELRLTEDGFQTIQPITFELDFAYSFGASAGSDSQWLTYFVKQ